MRNGRAVFFPVYKGTFERGSPELMVISQQESEMGSYAYTEYLAQLVKDFRRSVDYLETRDDIAHDKLAYYGVSWGALLGGKAGHGPFDLHPDPAVSG